jgi:ribosomal protein L11 methyltransferase
MKSTGALRQISVSVSAEAEEAVLELMAEIFGQPASFYSNAETGAQVASVYLENKTDWNAGKESELSSGLERLKECGLAIGPGTISCKSIPKEDWAESWKKHFKVMEIGRSLLIRPSWLKPRKKRGQHKIVLDPGLSFGTGQHPTTLYCLQELVHYAERGGATSFLDIGTGSGILAIAAAKLGCKPVEAFDFDPEAVRIARRNAQENGVVRKLRITHQDLTKLPLQSKQQFSFVCANLILDLLLEQKERIINRLKLGGILVLAGILKTQFEEVRQGFEECGMMLLKSKALKEWKSGTFIRTSARKRPKANGSFDTGWLNL